MARHREAVCRLCRREGQKLFLKGLRCFTEKCAIEKRNFVPGQHGQSRRVKSWSGYGLQLREKQKVKRTYGLLERQFRNYVEKSERAQGPHGSKISSSCSSGVSTTPSARWASPVRARRRGRSSCTATSA